MKAHILDEAALASRTPADLMVYLRSRGWVERAFEHGPAGLTEFVVTKGDEEFEVLVPKRQDLRGYASLISEALRVLAVVEDRSEFQILTDLGTVAVDIPYVQMMPDGPSGTTPILDGVEAFCGLRDLLSSAAIAVVNDTTSLTPVKYTPKKVSDFLRNVRLGAPAPGSYIISAQIPIPPDVSPTLNDEVFPANYDEQPFNRTVSLRMRDAVESAHAASNTTLLAGGAGLDIFEETAYMGVTANLMEALVDLGGVDRHPYRMWYSWALHGKPVKASKPVLFTPDILSVLEEVARTLRQHQSEEGVRVVGDVVRLHREGGGAGDVSIVGRTVDSEDDRLVRMWLNLTAEDYQIALNAHERQRMVEAIGDLEREGRKYKLSNVQTFTMLPQSSSDAVT